MDIPSLSIGNKGKSGALAESAVHVAVDAAASDASYETCASLSACKESCERSSLAGESCRVPCASEQTSAAFAASGRGAKHEGVFHNPCGPGCCMLQEEDHLFLQMDPGAYFGQELKKGQQFEMAHLPWSSLVKHSVAEVEQDTAPGVLEHLELADRLWSGLAASELHSLVKLGYPLEL